MSGARKISDFSQILYISAINYRMFLCIFVIVCALLSALLYVFFGFRYFYIGVFFSFCTSCVLQLLSAALLHVINIEQEHEDSLISKEFVDRD